MKKKTDSLVGLLNLNGSLYRGVRFHEPYSLHRLVINRKSNLEDLSGLGEILVEKLKRIKSLQGSLRNFGISPYIEKFLRKNSGKIL
jgi:hypothetical protein